MLVTVKHSTVGVLCRGAKARNVDAITVHASLHSLNQPLRKLHFSIPDFTDSRLDDVGSKQEVQGVRLCVFCNS